MSKQVGVNDITRYKIINKIGEGCSDEVYRIKDIETGHLYAAKISKFIIDEDTKDSSELLSHFREIKLMSFLNHPSVLRFYEYYLTNFEQEPCPTIITEIATNGSLRDIFDMERSGICPSEWNYTKKLINIYGIASGMSYLHAYNILHRDLKLENILLDDFLHPKIADFGLAKITDFITVNLNVQFRKGIKGTPVYMAPEILTEEKYSNASDVYSFAIIVYEIMTCKQPFKNFNIFKLITLIIREGYRPEISEDIPESYRSLIERCWAQKPEDRPSFDEIVEELRTNHDFITDLVDENEFLDYVDFIDNSNQAFESKTNIKFEDFISGRKKKAEPIKLDNPEKKKKKSHHHHHHKKRKCSVIKESESEPNNESKSEDENESKLEDENESKSEPNNEIKTEDENDSKLEYENESKSEPNNESKTEDETESKLEPNNESKSEPNNESKTEDENESKSEPNNKSKSEDKNESKSEPKNESKSEQNNDSSQLGAAFDIDQYEIIKKIGKGSFGKVFKVKEKKTGEIYAAKVAKKMQINNDDDEEDDDEILDLDLQREINNSNKFNHPAIVKFIGFSLFDFTGAKRPVIVIEYMGGGSLSSLLKKAKKGLSDPRFNDTKKLIILYGIAAAMNFLHEHNVIHRDLKPDNILMDEDLNPKIADFGLSKTLHSNQESMSVSSKANFKGTLRYSPPEKLNGEPSTKACDVYSFALIAYEIITNETPFENCTFISLANTLCKNERPHFNSDTPKAYKELIKSCWDQDPQNRPTFSQIVNALKKEPGFITDLVDEGEFLRYVDHIDESPISFINKKIIPTFKEFCKEKLMQKVVESSITTQSRSSSLAVKNIVETESTTQTRSLSLNVKKDQVAKDDDNDDDSLEEIRNKKPDELFEIWEKMFYAKGSSSVQQKNSLKYVKLAAEKGHVTAMFSYASMLYNGIGTRINRKEASVYFKKAADEGHIQSMHFYASIMNKGDGVIINSKEALEYFKKAADKGHVESMYRYAMMQYKNYTPSRNEEEAKIYCKKAADNGHINAMYSYAMILSKNEQTKSDSLKNEEIKIYLKTAAENGHVKAMFNFAQILCKEKENKDLIKDAAKFYKMAADNGHIDSMHFYADLLRKNEGDHFGELKDEIPQYYKLAADNGYVDSMLCYAEILSKGIGVNVNKEESAKYYKMAADKGKKEAMLIYADILSKGIGVPANKKESKFYIQMAKNIK